MRPIEDIARETGLAGSEHCDCAWPWLERFRAIVRAEALTEEQTFEPISDDEQAALYRHCEGTDHYSVVRRLYRNSCKLPPDLFERERAATICDDLAEMMERGAGECAPGERLRQAARNIREGRPPLSDVCISAPSAEG